MDISAKESKNLATLENFSTPTSHGKSRAASQFQAIATYTTKISFFLYHENIGWNFAWHSRVLHSLRIMSQGRKLKGLQGVRAFPKKSSLCCQLQGERSLICFFLKIGVSHAPRMSNFLYRFLIMVSHMWILKQKADFRLLNAEIYKRWAHF